jgi:hypothetical protein
MGRNVPIWDVTKRIPQYYNVDFRLLVGWLWEKEKISFLSKIRRKELIE